jgi:hypothetical protein
MDELYLAHQEGAGGAAQISNAAAGKGQVSATVAKNMGLNVGGGKDAAGFMADNHKALSAAYAKANTPDVTRLATALPEMVAANTPPEVSKVEVTNQAADKKQAGTQAPAQAPTKPSSSNNTVIASLSEIPVFFPDTSMLPLLLGRT